MAGLTKAQRAERDAEKKDHESDDGLIAMQKGGETIRVHPSCVKAHEAVGWKATG